MYHKYLFKLFTNSIVRVLYPLRPFCRLKVYLLRKLGASIGLNCFIHQNVFIAGHDSLCIGSSCVLSRGATIVASGGLTIGDNVLVGYDSKILTRNHKIPQDWSAPIRWAGHINKPVVIEDDCWLGSNVVVLPGVTIRKGCVIAAGGVVTRDTEEYGIYGGIPAKLIKIRERV
jgi:acetyltransferase-like isoleucine patch superfamily enzyme